MLKDKIVFISGPMSGKPGLNFDAFFSMEKMLIKNTQCKVINPARNPDGLCYEEYMELNFQSISQSDIILLLDGFEHSPGSLRELQKALEYGCTVLTEKQFYELLK